MRKKISSIVRINPRAHMAPKESNNKVVEKYQQKSHKKEERKKIEAAYSFEHKK